MDAKPDVELRKKGDCYSVYLAGQKLGVILRYDNSFHKRNCYLKISMDVYSNGLSCNLFRQLVQQIGQPLQVMVDSTDTQLTFFLLEGGFFCRRKCYETEATLDDYVGTRLDIPICFAQRGEAMYAHCSEMMYCYYRESHAAINPLTASYTDFCHKLPQHVCYEMQDDKVIHCAFLEENEIAYVCSKESGEFLRFAEGLICRLFSRYKTICFESDDCDAISMQLKNLFVNQNEASYDTYVYDYEGSLS